MEGEEVSVRRDGRYRWKRGWHGRHGRKKWDARRPRAEAWMHGSDVGMEAEGTTCVVRHRGTVHRRPPCVLALERVDRSSRGSRSHPFFSTKARRFTPSHPCACHSSSAFGSTCVSFSILLLRHPNNKHAKRFHRAHLRPPIDIFFLSIDTSVPPIALFRGFPSPSSLSLSFLPFSPFQSSLSPLLSQDHPTHRVELTPPS